MAAPRRHLVNASDAAAWLLRAHHLRVAPATIRTWATRKRIGSYGFGRERYDLREVVAYALQQSSLRPDHGP